jgi:hypothetical protein
MRHDFRIRAGPDGLWAEISVDLTDDLVFAAGAWYHRTPNCDELVGDYLPIQRQIAEDNGYAPCPVCWPGS